jgi:ankyrin repeat protein
VRIDLSVRVILIGALVCVGSCEQSATKSEIPPLYRSYYEQNPADRELWLAILQVDYEGVKRAIADGANLNPEHFDGSTPLIRVVQAGSAEITELLIAHGANVNGTDRDRDTALHQAVRSRNNEIMALLLANGASPSAKDDRSKTPLMIARDILKKDAALGRSNLEAENRVKMLEAAEAAKPK